MPRTLSKAERLCDDYGLTAELANLLMEPFDAHYSARAVSAIGQRGCRTIASARQMMQDEGKLFGSTSTGKGTMQFIRTRLGL